MARVESSGAQVGVARPLTLLVASGAAIAGLVMLLVCWLSVGTATLDATESKAYPCLVAVDAQQAGAAVHNSLLPPRATCEWTPPGGPREVVVIAQGSTPLFLAGATLVIGGIGVCAAVLLTGRRGAPRG